IQLSVLLRFGADHTTTLTRCWPPLWENSIILSLCRLRLQFRCLKRKYQAPFLTRRCGHRSGRERPQQKDEMNMKKATCCHVFSLPPSMWLSQTQILSAGPAKNRVRHGITAAWGEASPAGGVYGPLFLNATLNARHEVAFDALVSGPPPTI